MTGSISRGDGHDQQEVDQLEIRRRRLKRVSPGYDKPEPRGQASHFRAQRLGIADLDRGLSTSRAPASRTDP